MHDTAHLMETALRVLIAVSNKCRADPHDVEELVKFAGPQPEGIGLEEFACTVIQKALQARAEGAARQPGMRRREVVRWLPFLM